MKNRQKTFYIYSIFIVITMFTLSGCGDRTQIEDRDFILAAGVSYESDMYKMSLARPDLSALTGQSVGEEEKLVVTYKGYNFTEIISQYSLNSNKMLDFSHMKAIILDYEIISDEEKMNEFLQYAKNNYKMSRNILVFFTDIEEEALMDLNNSISGNIGEYLEKIYENNIKKTYEKKTTIGDLIQSLYETDKVVLVPCVKVEDKKPAISGGGVFQKGILVKELTQKELESICLSRGVGRNYNITMENDTVVKIKRIKQKCHFTISKGYPDVLIELKGEAEILENPKGKSVDIIKEELEKITQNMVTENLNQIMKLEKIDFMNLYRICSYKEKEVWLHYKDKQEWFSNNLNYRVTTKFNIAKNPS